MGTYGLKGSLQIVAIGVPFGGEAPIASHMGNGAISRFDDTGLVTLRTG